MRVLGISEVKGRCALLRDYIAAQNERATLTNILLQDIFDYVDYDYYHDMMIIMIILIIMIIIVSRIIVIIMIIS